MKKIGRAYDRTGSRYGRLIVIDRADNSEGSARWNCKCDCGGNTTVLASNLSHGNVQSCGCLMRERVIAAKTVHGREPRRLYTIWCAMRQRCLDGKAISYPNYGGRGIRVCEEWSDYRIFRDWAITSGYSEGLTIDRIDNDLGYCPTNCRWATHKEQGRNKRNNRPVIRSDGLWFGSIAEAAEASKCDPSTIGAACSGKAKTALGFAWRYADEKQEAA